MKLLWVKADFLHPTTRGGQIRSLEMLRRLRARHEVHYVAFEDPYHPEAVSRSHEYCTRAYPIKHHVPPRRSLAFVGQLIQGVLSAEPVSIRRYRSTAMRQRIEGLLSSESFDSCVCDFLTPAVNFPDLRSVVLFQHNVESMIWRRLARNASSTSIRAYLHLQADRMERFERQICRTAAHVVAVSALDAAMMRQQFGIEDVSDIPTGVDVAFFTPHSAAPPVADLVFVGSMDWLPNIDAVNFFVDEILPLIRHKRPACSVAIVGRAPSPALVDRARSDRRLVVTGTVGDVRPYLWGAEVSIVPLRIGGGTRLKIYEAMAAKIPVVSTTIGAEGLNVSAPRNIRLADTADEFANQCLHLLDNADVRTQMAEAAYQMVASDFSWDTAARRFEDILMRVNGADGYPRALSRPV
jgi:glycosyltransferase involved in cell wall biosynthesis